MTYSFEAIVDRTGTNAIKWDSETLGRLFELKDQDNYLPLWVADMDFQTAPHIIEALKARVEHGIYGYAMPAEDYFDALAWWMENRHSWPISKEWVTSTPGIVPALNFIVRALTEAGDKVIIQEPVYGPFRKTVTANDRIVVNNALLRVNGQYVMDYEDLEQQVSDPQTKLLILCSPHNPVGRVWRPEELKRLGEICNRHGVIVVADEIHNDLIVPGSVHTVYATLGEEFANRCIICTAPSKTFNLAGMQSSSLIIPNGELKKKIDEELAKSSIGAPNLFGIVATTAAYSPQGAEWLDAMLRYLNDNLVFMEQFVEDHMTGVTFIKQEGTYLSWLDFSGMNMAQDELERIIKEEAKVILDPGSWFGEGGAGFMRINAACPRSILAEALERIWQVIYTGHLI